MRTLVIPFALLAASGAGADDTARTIVEAAIKAHGEGTKIAKLRTMRIKVEGTMVPAPGQPAVPFTIEDVWQMPDKYRTTTTFTFMGRAVPQTLVIDGDKGWLSINGEVQDMAKPALDEMREQRYAEDLDRLGFLGDKGVELSSVDEVKVNGKPAAGVLIKTKGHRDVKLYFDKATGLLVRRDHPVLDPATGKEVTQAVEFADHADTDGVKHYKTITAYREGKKVIAAKVTEVEFLDKVDPKLFTKP
jgi:hypothetical protein